MHLPTVRGFVAVAAAFVTKPAFGSRQGLALGPIPPIPPILAVVSFNCRRPVRSFSGTAPRLGNQAIRLRDYQEECIQAVLASLENGHKRLGISLATGGGKTIIFTQLIDRIRDGLPDATQTLILAHRRELVQQAARHCNDAYPAKRVEVEMANSHSTGTADVTIASVQTLSSKDRLAKFDPERFKLVLVDEAHHIVSPSYMRVLRHFGLDKKSAGSPALVGVSATFSRFDGLRLGAAIDELVYHKDYVDMIGAKWLSDVIFTTVESTADLSKVRRQAHGGDFAPADLSKAVNTDTVNQITVRTWLAKGAGRKSTLVFCVDLAHVAGLTRAFRQHGVDARFVTGDTPAVERSRCLEAFKRGDFPVLINCGVFTEGTDIPNIDCVLLARPTKSRNLLVQMIGRGMRLSPGKRNCHVIDMVSSLETGIVSTPTLFGLDPTEIVECSSVDEMRQRKERKESESLRKELVYEQDQASGPAYAGATPRLTFTDYETVFDLIADTSGEKHIRSISQYAWVNVSPDKYILSGPTGTFLRLEKGKDKKSGEMFKVWEVRALPAGLSKSPFAAPREVVKALTFSDAVHGADSFAAKLFPHFFISRYQKWRSGPPTDGQLDFLNKLRNKQEPLTADNTTKGQASDMITKIKHGARGRFSGIEAKRRRIDREKWAVEQERERQLGEHVTVGPVPV